MFTRPKFFNRDLVKTSKPRLHQKIHDQDLKICGLCRYFSEIFQKISSPLRSWNVSNFCNFPTCCGCFLSAKTAEEKLVKLHKFY